MGRRRLIPRLAVAAALTAAAALAFVFRQHFDIASLTRRVAAEGALAPLVYMTLYAVATVLFVPGSVLTLASGALFGPLWGAAYALFGATAGAMVDFVIARYLLSAWVAAKAGGRLKRLIAGVEAEGWRFVAFTRLVPFIPFNLLNYALGLTRIRFAEYALATLVCMVPGAAAYAYLGYAGREALAGGEALVQKGLIALGLVAFAMFLPRIVRRWRRRGNGAAPDHRA